MSHIVLRRTVTRVAVTAFLAGLAGLTCLNPTDRSSEVYVTLGAIDPLLRSDSVVLQGTQAMLIAHAWQRLPPRDSLELPNVEFKWVPGNATIATVQAQGGGAARLTGIAPGRTTITVAAIPYESSKPATFPLRVSTPFTLDSVRADTASYSAVATFNGDLTHHTVKYGQLLTFYGVGVRGIFFAQLPDAVLFADTFSFKGVPEGIGQMSFWVLHPAQSGRPVALALGGNAFDTTTIQVRHRDIYKVSLPRDTLPRTVSLDVPGPIPQYQALLFYDPALAYEDLVRPDTIGADWFRFTRADTTKAVTLVLKTGETGNLTHVLLSDSIDYTKTTTSYSIGSSAWTIGPREYDCRGRRFVPAQAPPDSVIIALRTLPRGLHLLSPYAIPGSYQLIILDGYVSQLLPDRFTGNSTCTLADLNFAVPALNISVSSAVGFRDSTLTLDNPQAVDWYRFHVTPAALQTVQIQSRPLPFTAGLDSSAMDLYVLSTDTLAMLGKTTATVPGARDSLNLSLATGDYYLVVVDFAGVPTRYAVCIAVGLFPHCDPATTAAPPLGVSAAERLPSFTPPSARHGPRPTAAPRSSSGRRVPWRR